MEIRATTKLRNNKIIAARENLNMSQPEFAKAADVSVWTLRRLEKLNFSKNITGNVTKLASFLDCLVEDIMPDSLLGTAMPDEMIRVQNVNPQQLLEYKESSQKRLISSVTEQVETKDELEFVKKILENNTKNPKPGSYSYFLRPREKQVIEMRYGLSGGPALTVGEIAKKFKITTQCVRDKERRAIRKLQYFCNNPQNNSSHNRPGCDVASGADGDIPQKLEQS